jgi:hypothetical protein
LQRFRLPTPQRPTAAPPGGTGGRVRAKRVTGRPDEKHGDLTDRGDLPDSAFALPKKRKGPLTGASHVRNAPARFARVEGVTDEEREQAFANIRKAARHSGVEMTAKSWRELGKAGK